MRCPAAISLLPLLCPSLLISTTMTGPASFAALPLEIAEQALILSDPDDIAAASRASKALFQMVYKSDAHIWRSCFLRLFDDPRLSPHQSHQIASGQKSYDWRSHLQRRVHAKHVLLSHRTQTSPCRGSPENGHREALETLIDMIATAPPSHPNSTSLNVVWVENVLQQAWDTGYRLWSSICNGPLDLHAKPTTSQSSGVASLQARLGLYFGLINTDKEEASPTTSSYRIPHNELRLASRSRVYDLRRYNKNSRWYARHSI